MKKINNVIGSILLFAASVGHAQTATSHDGNQTNALKDQVPAATSEDDWQFSVTPYLWMPLPDVTLHLPVKLNGTRYDGEITLSPSWGKVLGNLGGKLMVLSADGRFEFNKGTWGGFVDGYWIYSRVTADSDGSKFLLHDKVDEADSLHVTDKTQTGQVNFGPQYRLGTIPFDKTGDYSVGFQLYGGGRVNWIRNKLDGSVNLNHVGVNFNTSSSRAFAEPMIGLKTTWALGHDFIGIIRGDVGGWNLVDNNTDCDLEAGIAWQFHKNTYLDLAYRARGQWQTDGSGNNITVRGWYHGPELGMTFLF